MLKLLRKDLILNGRVIGATYAFWSLFWLGGPATNASGNMTYGTWSGMVSIPCAFLPVMMLMREDRFRAGALACSLPVTRKDIVASKYLGGWLVALTAVAIAVLAMLALSLFGVRPLLPPTPLMPVVVVTVIGTILAVMMPLAVRFGVVGVIGPLVALQLLGVVALLVSALFGVPAALGIESAVRWVARSLQRLRGELGPLAFSIVLVASVLAVNVASFRLSSWLYRRREF
jgi:hypothetical protein